MSTDLDPAAPAPVAPAPARRDELLREMLRHKVAAAAIEAKLKADALAAYQRDGQATTRYAGVGQIIVSLAQDGPTVVDAYVDAFLDWLAREHPGEVITVRQVRNPAAVKAILAKLNPVDPDELDPGESTPLCDNDGVVVPGVVWTRGGHIVSTSIRPDDTLRRRLATEAAARYPTDNAAGHRNPA